LTELRVLRALQDLKAHKATRGKKVLTEPKALKALRDLRAIRVKRA